MLKPIPLLAVLSALALVSAPSQSNMLRDYSAHLLMHKKPPNQIVAIPNPLIDDGIIYAIPHDYTLSIQMFDRLQTDEADGLRGCLSLTPDSWALDSRPTMMANLWNPKSEITSSPHRSLISLNRFDVDSHVSQMHAFGYQPSETFKSAMPFFLFMHEVYHAGAVDQRYCDAVLSLDLEFFSEVGADTFAAITTVKYMQQEGVDDNIIHSFLTDLIAWRSITASTCDSPSRVTHLTQAGLHLLRQGFAERKPWLSGPSGLRDYERLSGNITYAIHLSARESKHIDLTTFVDLIERAFVINDKTIALNFWMQHLSPETLSPLINNAAYIHHHLWETDSVTFSVSAIEKLATQLYQSNLSQYSAVGNLSVWADEDISLPIKQKWYVQLADQAIQWIDRGDLKDTAYLRAYQKSMTLRLFD